MKLKNRFRYYAVLLSVLIFSGHVNAMLIGGGRFDWLIDKAEVVVKAQIAPIEEGGFGNITFQAKVISILKSDGKPISKNLFLGSSIFIWPNDLGVPFEKKQVVLVFLRRIGGELEVVNNFRAILPATKSAIKHKDDSAISRKVFDELHAFLPKVTDEVSQALVLVHLSHIALKTDEKIFLPYVKSKNKWHRRAALACLLRISPTNERIKATVADFESYLSRTPVSPLTEIITSDDFSKARDDQLFWSMYQDVQWVSRCGAWGSENNMKARAIAYLPIYRILIDDAARGNKNIYIGIDALKSIGTREDIHRLYKHLNHEKASLRHDVIEGIGRILGMNIKRPHIQSYLMPESRAGHIQKWEKEMQAIIKKAIEEEPQL
ncbi:MAG: hypothetical protein FVQ82_00070 [Planctomycetes bacterium]|nr:hypothetical protein [Planctomycetota bacterium]